MKLITSLNEPDAAAQHGAVTIGNFDGVHLGHARIIERLTAKAKALGGPAVVLTFDPHPVRLLRPEETPPPLTWVARKTELLAALGVDWVIAYPTDEALLALSPREFFDEFIVRKLKARAVVEGTNFYFGRGRAGSVETLAAFCKETKIDFEVAPPVRSGEAEVSSSRIRQALLKGDVDAACGMLTAPYRLRGIVTHGAMRGARIGFATANLSGVDTLIPGHGVYAGAGFVRGQALPAAIHIGPNPTFGEQHAKLEVHFPGWSEPLYGEPLEIDFLRRLRDIQPFESVDALVRRLQQDVAAARGIGTEYLANLRQGYNSQ